MRKSMGFLVVLLFVLTMSFTAFGQLPTFSYGPGTTDLGSVNNTHSGTTTTGSGSIVGSIPDDTTSPQPTITTVVVPIVLNIKQGGTAYTFDPTVTHSGCLDATTDPITLLKQSPLFQAVSISINGTSEGTVQWLDAIQRAEFQNDPNHPTNANHHTKLSNPPTIITNTTNFVTIGSSASPIDVGTSGNSFAQVFPSENCNTTAPQVVVDINAEFNANHDTIRKLVEAAIGTNSISSSQLALFPMYNTTMVNGVAPSSCNHPTSANCDVQGFHNALGVSGNPPTPSAPGQTYAMANFQGNASEFTGVSDISAIAAEIAEWANNPSTKNTQSPAWGSIGEESGCVTDRFEVGEPLKGTLAPSITHSSFTYNFPEVTFLSWFYRDSISRGVGYSSNGTITGYAKVCPTGGTN